MKNAYNILFRKLEWKRQLLNTRCKQDSNFKMVLKEIGCEGVDWIHSG